MEDRKTAEKPVCATCGGTGEISYFAGVSRFLLTSEECPACFGTGFEPDNNRNGAGEPASKEDSPPDP